MQAHEPRVVRGSKKRHGSVAMILREDEGEVQVLFIERAERQGDLWSGHIAFPGGTVEPEDESPRRGAERETMEEIGLELGSARYLGRLDDLTAAMLPVLVSGFVYRIDRPGEFVLSEEIRQTFWRPLSHLIDQANHTEHRLHYDGAERTHPAIDLLGPGRPVLWGLTYRFVAQMLELVGITV